MLSNRAKWWLEVAALILAIFLVLKMYLTVSEQDYQEQKQEERENCRAVELGYEPSAKFSYCPDYSAMQDGYDL